MEGKSEIDLKGMPERKTAPYDWQVTFDQSTIEAAKKLLPNVVSFENNPGRSFEIDIKASAKAKGTYHVSLTSFPQSFGTKVNMYQMRCTCPTANSGYWGQSVCPHKAVLFMKMYEEVGPIMLKEGNDTYYKRLRAWHVEQLEKKRLQGIQENRQDIPVKQVLQ